MSEVERIVDIDVAVSVGEKVAEDVMLQRVRRLHDKSIQVQPPEPVKQSTEHIVEWNSETYH